MSFVVPTYTAPGGSWQLVDLKPRLMLTATADSNGTATATGPSIDPGYMWAIQRAVASSTSSAVPSLRIYDGDPDPSRLVTGTDRGAYDEGEYPAGPGALFDQSTQIVAQWSGCTPGAKCTLRLQVGVMQQVTG